MSGEKSTGRESVLLNTTELPRPGLESKTLNPEASSLTTAPPTSKHSSHGLLSDHVQKHAHYRPYARPGHIVQNYIYWWASCPVGLPKHWTHLPLFCKSHCATCSPVYVILYHVTGSCKGPIKSEFRSLIGIRNFSNGFPKMVLLMKGFIAHFAFLSHGSW